MPRNKSHRRKLARILVFDKNSKFDTHSHSEGQFMFPSKGSLWVKAGDKSWYLHSNCGLWIPPHLPHSASQFKDLEVISIYLDEKSCASGFNKTFSVRIEPLLRELLKHVKDFDKKSLVKNKELLGFLIQQIETSKAQDICIPSCNEPRLRKCFGYVVQNIDLDPSLVETGKASGASPKTLERLFRSELKTSFQSWKQSLKMVLAASYLYEGMPITEISLAVGYQSLSAFIHCFKKFYGVTPKRYLLG